VLFVGAVVTDILVRFRASFGVVEHSVNARLEDSLVFVGVVFFKSVLSSSSFVEIPELGMNFRNLGVVAMAGNGVSLSLVLVADC